MFTGNNFKYKRSKVLCSCFVIFLFTLLLMGCFQTTPTQEMSPKPPKPILEIQENPKDPKGICLDEINTYLLLDYIWQLEEGYN